jgi:hypothetical protein
MASAGAGGPASVGDVLGQVLLQTLERAEEELDEKLERMDDRPDEDELERLRRQRLDKLRKVQSEKAKWAALGHGDYRDCVDQKQFFEELKKEQRAVVHFYRPSNRRCDIVDAHLRVLAKKHVETKFMRIDAERSPFVAEKLKIWALPTIVLVKDGKTDHSIIGFEELGGRDDFSTETLERVLLAHEVLLESFC